MSVGRERWRASWRDGSLIFQIEDFRFEISIPPFSEANLQSEILNLSGPVQRLLYYPYHLIPFRKKRVVPIG
jgi:hypothetical protein